MRKLTMLGTGNAMVTKCYNTCFYVTLDDGALFLTDAGGGTGTPSDPVLETITIEVLPNNDDPVLKNDHDTADKPLAVSDSGVIVITSGMLEITVPSAGWLSCSGFHRPGITPRATVVESQASTGQAWNALSTGLG